MNLFCLLNLHDEQFVKNSNKVVEIKYPYGVKTKEVGEFICLNCGRIKTHEITWD